MKPPWQPSLRCRRWLFVGILAVLADLLAGVTAAILEFQYWGEDGFTPDQFVSLAAIAPQTLVIVAYLVLARDAEARGLWKSAAGTLASYLLLCLIDLSMLEVLPAVASVTIVFVAAIGLFGLLAFTVGGVPRFGSGSDTGAGASDAASSTDPGWIAVLVMVIGFVIVRIGYRNLVKPNIGGWGADDWAMLELCAIGVFGMLYAVWFAAAKIRLRGTLGRMALVTGVVELILLLVFTVMLLTMATVLVMATGNPEFTEERADELFDSWMKPTIIFSTVCHAIWVLSTVAFFISLRSRPALPDPERSA